jgi:hypothetical protein
MAITKPLPLEISLLVLAIQKRPAIAMGYSANFYLACKKGLNANHRPINDLLKYIGTFTRAE